MLFLSLSELKLGLIPSTIAPFLLRKVGMKHLKYYGLCSQRISAVQGQSIGLVHHLVDNKPDLDTEIARHIDMFLELSPQAIARYKKMCEDVQFLSLSEARGVTSEEIADIRTTEEAQEGLRAFFEKRKPNWKKFFGMKETKKYKVYWSPIVEKLRPVLQKPWPS
ncbi:MAG: enoyl-CoA hydratase-related protein [Bdellovibrionota bacterium]